MFHSPNKSVLYCAYRLEVEHSTATGSINLIQGTAFYVKKNSDLFLVTNRHNLDAPMKNRKYAGYKPSGLKLSGYFNGQYLTAELARQELAIGFPDNDEEDVAAIRVTNVPFIAKGDMLVTQLNYDLLADADMLAKIDVCDLVALPGYPDFYDRNGNRPIMRMGTIASDPESDYCDLGMRPARRIAYEAFSSAGSSGSPVFALAKGMRTGAGLSGGYFRDICLLGVNAGHLRGARMSAAICGLLADQVDRGNSRRRQTEVS